MAARQPGTRPQQEVCVCLSNSRRRSDSTALERQSCLCRRASRRPPPLRSLRIDIVGISNGKFTLHCEDNDSCSHRRDNLSIHLAEKCSTIMTSDPHFFSRKTTASCSNQRMAGRHIIQTLSRNVLCLQITKKALNCMKY